MVKMMTIGDVGIADDAVLSLFQCPKCKAVRIQKWIDGTPIHCLFSTFTF